MYRAYFSLIIGRRSLEIIGKESFDVVTFNFVSLSYKVNDRFNVEINYVCTDFISDSITKIASNIFI